MLLSLLKVDDRLCGCGGLVSSRMGFNKPETRGGAPARNMPCGKCALPQHFPSPVKEVFRDLIVSTGSVLADRNRLQPDRLRALGGLSRRRQGLYVYIPASSAGANARLPVRKPPPRGSCKGVFRPCPPAPLLVAGGDDKLSSSIRFLPFFVWLPYGDWLAQYRGSVHLLICRQKKAAKPIFLTVLRPFKPVFISWIPVGHTIPAVFSFSQLRTWR